MPPLLTSFKTEALQGARDAAPELPRGWLLDSLPEGWLQTALDLGCIAIVCNHALWDERTVAQASNGRGVNRIDQRSRLVGSQNRRFPFLY